MKKLQLFLLILLVQISTFAQTITPAYQAKLDSVLNPLSAIVVPFLKADTSFRARGNLKRSYFFAEAGQQMPYRLYVPTSYKAGKTPLVMLLHGGGSDENTLMDRANTIAMKLAEKHGYIVVSPLGYTKIGAYGSYLRLPAVYGKPDEQAKQKVAFAADTARQKTLALSEKDVMNVLKIVQKEYNPDSNNIFLAGHSMGSGGTWYLGAKYAKKWKALAAMSGPFIDETDYSFEKIKQKPIHVSEGIDAKPSLESSRLLAKYLKINGFNFQYIEVEADHPNMMPLVLPSIFEFFDKNIK